MEQAFWDSSSLIPLCVRRSATPIVQTLAANYLKAVWWGTPVEMRSGFSRLARMGRLSSNGQVQALVRLDQLRRVWGEVGPSERLRERAESLVERFPLKAADAFQLAAAWEWCLGRPRGRPFISGDSQLLGGARDLGFKAIEA